MSIFGRIDKGILFSSLLLMAFGIVFVYSSSFAVAEQKFGGSDFFLFRHLFRAGLGITGLFVFMNWDYHKVSKLSRLGYFVAIAMLVYILMLPDSTAINGSKRWINLGFLRFQVSEFARIIMIIAVASTISNLESSIKDRNTFFMLLAKVGVICALIVLEPDYSTAMLTGVIGFAVIFVAGARLSHIAMIVVGIIPVGIIGVISSPYRYRRLIAFMNLSDSKSDIGYQTYQSLVGLGNGGLFGTGLGQGEQKFFFLPEPYTDFIFSMIGEEIGFIGLMIVLGVFSFLIYSGLKVAMNAPDKLGQLIAFGLTLVIAVYATLHIAVNTGLVPTTGVPFPFLSYGGMSLVFNMCSIGILLNISSQRAQANPLGKRN